MVIANIAFYYSLVNMRVSKDVVAYFKDMTQAAAMPSQNLINLHLRDGLANGRKVHIN
jgi:hypothetical protein